MQGVLGRSRMRYRGEEGSRPVARCTYDGGYVDRLTSTLWTRTPSDITSMTW